MHGCVHTNDKKYSYSEIPEQSRTITHQTIPHPNALGKRIWDEETIYWKRESGYEYLTDRQIDGMIKMAFLEASIETPLVIRKKNRNMSDAHTIINFLGKKDDSYFKSDSTLAYGYGPAPGIGGDITFNADVLWLLRKEPLTMKEAFDLGYIDNYNKEFPNSTKKFYDPLHTMKHEGGHTLGMNHLTSLNLTKTAVMYPYYNGLRRFGDADINYLQSLYGKSSVPHIIKETLLARIQRFA